MSPEAPAGFPIASAIDPETRRLLCVGCEQPILAEDLGGVGRAEGGGEAWFHNFLPCMLAASEHMISTHSNELKGIARGRAPKPDKPTRPRQHGRVIPF